MRRGDDCRLGKRRHSGTKGNDVIVAGGGRDVIRAGSGHDLICGGRGADLIYAGDGSDEMGGGRGADVIMEEGARTRSTTGAARMKPMP